MLKHYNPAMKRNQRNYDFTQLLQPEHAGKWIALTPDRKKVIGFSEHLDELTRRLGTDNVVYMKAREQGVAYAF